MEATTFKKGDKVAIPHNTHDQSADGVIGTIRSVGHGGWNDTTLYYVGYVHGGKTCEYPYRAELLRPVTDDYPLTCLFEAMGAAVRTGDRECIETLDRLAGWMSRREALRHRIVALLDGPVSDRLTGDECAEFGVYDVLNELRKDGSGHEFNLELVVGTCNIRKTDNDRLQGGNSSLSITENEYNYRIYVDANAVANAKSEGYSAEFVAIVEMALRYGTKWLVIDQDAEDAQLEQFEW